MDDDEGQGNSCENISHNANGNTFDDFDGNIILGDDNTKNINGPDLLEGFY